jgi:hypothetical protein
MTEQSVVTDLERERRVRFHGRVQFKTIRHVTEFSEDEILAGWYRKKDFMRMSEDVSEIAQLVAKGKESHNGEELCIRGLEHLVEEDVADYRAEKMIASIDAVLDEQDEQRDEDVNDPDIIAELYTEIVTPLLREAYLVGLRDAKEATVAAEQIPDINPEDMTKNSKLPKSSKSSGSSGSDTTNKSFQTMASTPVEGEESLKNTDLIDDKKRKEAANNNKKGSKESNGSKITPKEKRKENRSRFGKGSERSPLVRRLDGSFAFRNKTRDLAKIEQSKQNRDCVRDSLFKHLDDLDSDSMPSIL